MTDSEKEISDLCVDCGMCCDGTLFSKARIRDEEDRKHAASMDFVTFELDKGLYFKMPCPHFAGCCSIYDRNRPHICSTFFCNPLSKVHRGEQNMAEAIQQVKALQEQRNKFMSVASRFPEFDGLAFKEIARRLEDLSEDNDKVSNYRHLFLLMYVFDDLRRRYFEPAPPVTAPAQIHL